MVGPLGFDLSDRFSVISQHFQGAGHLVNEANLYSYDGVAFEQICLHLISLIIEQAVTGRPTRRLLTISKLRPLLGPIEQLIHHLTDFFDNKRYGPFQ